MTALTIYEPFRGLFPHRRFVEDIFNMSMCEGISAEGSTMTPRVDVSENDDEYHVLADLPGFKKDEVDIEINDGYLKMTARHEGQKEEKKEKYLIQERCYGTWSRTFRLPEDVSSEGVKADMSEGILDVTLPKKEEAKPKKIEIKVH